MKKMIPTRRLIGSLLLGLLASCGGGGGGGGDSSSTGIGEPQPINDSYDAFAGGFEAVYQRPQNNDSLLSCASKIGVSMDSTVQGVIAFERPALLSTGLNYTAMVNAPARGIVVEAVAANGGRCSNTVLATTLTDGNGEYGLVIDNQQAVCIQIRAQMVRDSFNGGPAWDIQVGDNTRNNAPYYLLDNTPATPQATPVRNLLAPSGWGGNHYTQLRSAAALAILDSACYALATTLAVDTDIQLPTLYFRWSEDNNVADGDLSAGDIGGAFFSQTQLIDSNDNVLQVANQIFLTGDQDQDTDEYDQHVITHEFAHFLMVNVSRSDSYGGDHGLGDKLDMTVAYSEGWSDAFSGIALADVPTSHLRYANIYQDTLGARQANSFKLYLDANTSNKGWYSESTVYSFIYSLFDQVNSDSDQLTIPFSTLYNTLIAIANSESAISIFTYAHALKQAVSNEVSAIDDLLMANNIEPVVDEFGSGEVLLNNTDINGREDVFPVYHPIMVGESIRLCSNPQFGRVNKLSVMQYVIFEASSSSTYRFSVAPVSGLQGDGIPALEIYQAENYVLGYQLNETGTLTFSQSLLANSYLLLVYDIDNILKEGGSSLRRCFTVTVSK